jgi:hypothetical protein
MSAHELTFQKIWFLRTNESCDRLRRYRGKVEHPKRVEASRQTTPGPLLTFSSPPLLLDSFSESANMMDYSSVTFPHRILGTLSGMF